MLDHTSVCLQGPFGPQLLTDCKRSEEVKRRTEQSKGADIVLPDLSRSLAGCTG